MRPDGTGFVLAFDTAQAHCAASLLKFRHTPGPTEEWPLAARVEPMRTGQAERLIPLLEEMLEAHGLAWRDLDALGVGTGPGNFTGTRIAVAAARGLALGLGIPAVGVSYFEAMAPDRLFPYWALVPGPLGQTYAQRVAHARGEAVTLSAVEVEGLDGDRIWLQEVEPEAVIATMAHIARARFRIPDLPRPAPLYLRAPDAAPPRDPAPAILPG